MDVPLLKMAKHGLGLTNREIEMASGIHRNTISRAELGQAGPDAMQRLQSFFTRAGVEFVEDEANNVYGVLIRKGETTDTK